MASVLIFGLSWLAVSVVAALLIAGSIRIAERRRIPVATNDHDPVVASPSRLASVRGNPADSRQRVVLLFAQPVQRSIRAPRESSGR